MNTTLHETLLKTGMEPTTAEIYLTLVENGEMTVPKLLEKVPLSRATVYEALPTLLAEGFVEYRKEGRVAYYKPNHPSKLFTLIEEKKREVSLLEGEFKGVVQSLTGMFNLSNNQPGVRLFEGKEGMIEAYDTLLNLQQPIDSIEDKGDMLDFFGDYVKEYVTKRIERKIPNRAIAPDTNTINDPNPEKFIDSRLIPAAKFPFSMDIKICGDLVQIATLKEGQGVAVHISNPLIAANFRVMFNYMWAEASKDQAASDTPRVSSS